MISEILADCALRDLITQLTSASAALRDTLGMLDDDAADSADIVVLDNLDVAVAALDAAANYLTDLRVAQHASAAAHAFDELRHDVARRAARIRRQSR
jgi:hypothetical protein